MDTGIRDLGSPERRRGPLADADGNDEDAFSDLALTYISQMLMDEDDHVDNFHDYAALHATEKPFYDILGSAEKPDSSCSSSSPNNLNSSGGSPDGIWLHDFPDYRLSDLFCEPEPVSQFMGGEQKVKPEKEENESRGRKNPHSNDLDLEEGRSAKQTAVSFEDPTLRSDLFDDTLLYENGCLFPKAVNDIREAYRIGPDKNSRPKGRRKNQPKTEVVDLRTLLIQCAQMVAADDRRSAGELLRQIRQNASPIGDGSQRLAHYFAVGLEARLAGTGSEIYNSTKQMRRTAMDYLKAYQLYLAVCPFKKISYYFSNQHIIDAAEKATRVHVVDFGIGFGFQWPSLIQRLASRANGAPKLRITGIDFPQPGFRPRERLDETGRRLDDYAKLFNVPFEYRGVSSRWEDVRIEDLDLDEGEVLVVNCLYMFRYLADESVGVDCPRNTVLNTIRNMKPDIFVHGIVNGSYSAPFFVTRFREALFFYSAMFDVFETNVPREDEQRQLSEREIFGREIVNIVACEGSERVERPETYKQWHARNLRAGFVQRPLDKDILKKAKEKVRGCYHKDFVIDEDGRWLIQGWKGRIIFALSSWKPRDAS